MRHPRGLLPLPLLLAACGAGHAVHRSAAAPQPAPARAAVSRAVRGPAHPLQALVTDETQNELLVLDLPSARLVRRVAVPAGPEYVASVARGGLVIVVSSKAGKVTVLRRDTLGLIKTFGGFGSPHIPAISPDGQHLYVTDDPRGTLTAIRLSDLRVTGVIDVGPGAHHLSFSPDGRRVWIALSESASQIAILDTSSPDHPRLLGLFSPGFLAHDLAFSPDGRRVWVTSADSDAVGVFDASTRHLLFRVPVGAPPQHVVFAGRNAYLTSGYGSTLEKVDGATGRVITRTTAPYGSFELDAGHGYIVVSSLLRGTVADYAYDLTLLHVRALAPADRDVAIASH
jgi:YVTN family beta-propeller protein